MAKKTPNLGRDVATDSKSWANLDKPKWTEIHTETYIVNLLKTKDKEKTLKAVREKRHLPIGEEQFEW